MKRILIVTHHYPPHITGVGMIAQNHAKRLAALGHNVTVLTSETNPDEKSFSADDVDVIRIKAWNGTENFSAPFPIFSPALAPALWKAIKNADIVHIHDAFYMSSFLGVLFAHWQKKPIVLTQHVAIIAHPSKFVMAIQKIVYATTGAMIFHWSSLIFTYNDRVQQFLMKRGVPKEKLAVLMNGVDTDFFCPVSREEKNILRKKFGLSIDKKVILFVGRFVPKKGFDKVLAARSKQYQLALAGADAIEKNTPEVVFLGKLNPDVLARLYQAADVFILPSESEGFPLSIQEAMACGLPIITTHDDGYKDYQLDGKLVYFIDHPTNASVENAIQTIIDDDDHLKNMADYSRKYAETTFSWPLVVKNLNGWYERILAS